MSPLKLVIFALTSIFLIFISRKSLTRIRSHGFYRFFAWELIIILFLMNVDYWFISPLSLFQIISWTLLLYSGYLVISGFLLIRSKGNSSEQREDVSLYEIEKTTNLVTSGIYRYIRHPLYGSLLFLAWGIFFKSVAISGGIIAVGISLFLILTAKSEEKENLGYFGQAYKDYITYTKMFIPYIW